MKEFGILAHLSTLPGPYGIGTANAYDWVDFCAAAGASLWQVLPLGPTSYGDSPYQCLSAFAGNPYFIDLGLLAKKGLLEPNAGKRKPASRIDYEDLYRTRSGVLLEAFRRAERGTNEYLRWRQESAAWAEPYAEYTALKNRFGGKPWYEWEEWARTRSGDRYASFLDTTAEEREFVLWQQYEFDRQWRDLRTYAKKRGIKIIGDMSIYVALDSCDVWLRPDLFLLKEGVPTAVAGVPPDYFSETGQLWGNPLYDWNAMKEDGYAWWIDRMRRALDWYDLVRIDHFRGFSAFYAIPYGDRDARNGRWIQGPGIDLFEAMTRALGDLPVIAEDLGTLDSDVFALLEKTGFPGMKVLQFAFDGNQENPYLPKNHVPDCVVYTGTHDNPTTKEWSRSLTNAERRAVRRALGVSPHASVFRSVLEAALGSCADRVILPIQDLIGLGEEARMNEPSAPFGNWQWRMTRIPSAAVAERWTIAVEKARNS